MGIKREKNSATNRSMTQNNSSENYIFEFITNETIKSRLLRADSLI